MDIMTLLHDAYTALLSGLTHRTGKEINWHDRDGNPITVEPVDVERDRYVVRYYDENGVLWNQAHYLQDQLHGKRTEWYENGQLQWDTDFVNGKLHGKDIGWYDNGQLQLEKHYNHNQLHGKCIWWNKDGTLICENYYINSYIVNPEEWERHNEPTT